MRVDFGAFGDLDEVATAASAAERRGYDGVFTAETKRDPFLPLAAAATRTERVELGTGIAVAFARNPMTLANLANDMHFYSKGRFVLGLGSQIAPHITKRFSMPWSHPAARMRELVQAMRAIWACWNEGERLDFRGEFYTHTLMTPMFDPGPNPFGTPKVFVAAVGTLMTEVAGEVGDGMLVHAFTTEAYLRDELLPALDKGLDKAGRPRSDYELSGPVFVVTGRDEAETAAAARPVREQLAFYASTPAYRPVLDKHGWGDAQSELHTLSKQGEWVKMGDVFDDEMLDAFAVVGEPAAVAGKLLDRFGGLLDRVTLVAPGVDPTLMDEVLDEIVGGRSFERTAAASPASTREH